MSDSLADSKFNSENSKLCWAELQKAALWTGDKFNRLFYTCLNKFDSKNRAIFKTKFAQCRKQAYFGHRFVNVGEYSLV